MAKVRTEGMSGKGVKPYPYKDGASGPSPMPYKASWNAGSAESPTGETGPVGQVTNGKLRGWTGPLSQNSNGNMHGPLNTYQSPNRPGGK